MHRDDFQEALLTVMERKTHWAWRTFTSGAVKKSVLNLHLEQEYAVYIRDFAVLLGRAYAQCPLAAVRRELAENLYEEETGKLSRGKPHADLFLEYPRGLGMDLSRFEHVALLPAAARYRAALDAATLEEGWDVATAVTTLFVEGTEYERGELVAGLPKRPEPPLTEHPLVKHYGLPPDRLELVRAHRMVEGGHRRSAWHVVLTYVEPVRRGAVVAAMEVVLEYWQAYRDAVAAVCGVTRENAVVEPPKFSGTTVNG